ncbi:Glu/Leu/Phe/Val dehydrogenase [Mangrovimicrobium sediminis]|uniref:Glu/Leu/Phe/Val dehydrogenase n=1 Tax=Mangrovimicrobium sediminis TaxID=2562682 RepID=A0A4Z0LXP1_9GAMM|nr:Glu/Leu/Phe/Val dehydrogenase dimerization domain-containing protein [Haliea sp. SAOS-164]TGD72049.1 Glu/Leu/Phe/Val dehydrogenase [Haliea sp. SAOS-164]
MSVFSAPAYDRHELVSFSNDNGSGLRAIIAVHDSTLGPGVGGCRMFPYASEDAALHDVLRLSRGMTYKSAMAGLPLGGGKSVIIGDPRSDKSRDLLLAMGEFIDAQGGRYVAAEDSGTGVADMRVMAERTRWVSGLEDNRYGGDPSPSTAWGVFLAMRTAVHYRFGEADLKGRSVALQGLGHVGYYLAKYLREAGAEVYGADVNVDNLRRAVEELGVIAVDPAKVLELAVDVVAPCAMGAVLDERSIDALQAGIVCGAANNQLASAVDAAHLRDRGILYCPDFLVNAGGIIDVHHQRLGSPAEERSQHIARIEDNLERVLQRARTHGLSTHDVAEAMVEEYLEEVRRANLVLAAAG